MKGKEETTSPRESWTRPDTSLGAMARKRSYRTAREDKPRSQPVAPQAWLSTIPFAAILAVLAILTAAIVFVAFPGAQPTPKAEQPVAHQQGIAPPGWFQKAQKQFHK